MIRIVFEHIMIFILYCAILSMVGLLAAILVELKKHRQVTLAEKESKTQLLQGESQKRAEAYLAQYDDLK